MSEWLRRLLGRQQIDTPYPGLRRRVARGIEIWEGSLAINARSDSTRVRDEFTVRIELRGGHGTIPVVKEVGGRSQSIMTARGVVDARDIHINPGTGSDSGLICLAPAPDVRRRFPNKVDLAAFIKELVIPYFFGLNRFEATGHWPFGTYAHGAPGIYAYYMDNRHRNDSKILADCLEAAGLKRDSPVRWNGKDRCCCGSGNKWGKCHPKELKGVLAMIADCKKL